MNNTLTCLAVLFGCLSFSAWAHNGVNHDAPTTLKAPKGGLIKALDESKVEVVWKGKDIKIYLYDQNLKPAPAGEFTVVASAELPRSKKQEPVTLVANGTFFEGQYDAKGAHRFTLALLVTHAKTGRTEKLTFTIEPRK